MNKITTQPSRQSSSVIELNDRSRAIFRAIVEAFTDRQARLRLGELLGQGPDFDRATYTRL